MNQYKVLSRLLAVLLLVNLAAFVLVAEALPELEENGSQKSLKQKFREFSVNLNMSSQNLDEIEFKARLKNFFDRELNSESAVVSEEAVEDDSELIESVNVAKKISLNLTPVVESQLVPVLKAAAKKHKVAFEVKRTVTPYGISVDFTFDGPPANVKKLAENLMTLDQPILYKLGLILKN